MRVHGTTQCRPVELSALEEPPLLLPAPTEPYDVPIYATAKVHRDHHIEVAKALYSVPGNLIGTRVDVRADRSWCGSSPRPAGQGPPPPAHRAAARPTRLICPRSRPSTRCVTSTICRRLAAGHGQAIGAYAAALLDIPLPWTKMRQVYALLGPRQEVGTRHASTPPARRALDAEAINVGLIGRMLERAPRTTRHRPAGAAGHRRRRPVRPRRRATSPSRADGAEVTAMSPHRPSPPS